MNLKKILIELSVFLIPLGLVSFVFDLWALFNDFHIVVYFLFIILVYVLAIFILELRSKVLILEKKFKIALLDFQEYEASHLARVSDKRLVDNANRFSKVEFDWFVNGIDGVFTQKFSGINCSNNLSKGVPIQIGGECPISDLELLQLKAMDLLTGTELQVVTIGIQQLRKKILMIKFLKPLSKNQEFNVQIEGTWPSTFTREYDYVHFGLQRFKKGVELFSSTVSFLERPMNFELNYLKGDKLVKTPMQPEKILFNSSTKRYEIPFSIPYPEYKTLLLRFTRRKGDWMKKR